MYTVILGDIKFFYINKILKFSRLLLNSLKRILTIIQGEFRQKQLLYKKTEAQPTKYRESSTKPAAQPNCDRTQTDANYNG